jgi:hypothetical protein
LPILGIALAELLCTSLWFSANGAAADMQRAGILGAADIGLLTAAVQAGFLAGTLGLSLTGLADRYRASRIFAVSAVIGALANALFAFGGFGLAGMGLLRFVVGAALAGVYPLGMKLIVTWTRSSTATTLALLVGMLVIGTALPHGLKAGAVAVPWQSLVAFASVLSVMGGVLVYAIGDGPLARQVAGRRIAWGAGLQAFRVRPFRAAAFGYFGHMWELYAFWTLVPLLVAPLFPGDAVSAAGAAFVIIAVGAVGSMAAGSLALQFGSTRVAGGALAVSGALCVLYPLTTGWPAAWRVAALVVWGLAVVADSAQFSSLSAKACPPDLVGSSLAIQNSIGFALTIPAIAICTAAWGGLGEHVAWLLAPGPVLGIAALAFWSRSRS